MTQFLLWDAAAASLFNFNRRFRILRICIPGKQIYNTCIKKSGWGSCLTAVQSPRARTETLP